MSTYDLAIVGGGTGGLVAAHIAAGLGARVVLVERERTGGDCLWTGCVPSKSLLAAAELAHRMRNADRVGLAPVDPQIDFAAVMRRVRQAQTTIEPQDSPERLRAAGVEVLHADAAFTGPRTLSAGNRTLRFRRAIVATGSEPVVPPIPGLREAAPLTSENVWALDHLPPRLLVLGGGPIGCELGQAFARLGCAVTLVESGDRLLVREEPRAGRLVADQLRSDGVDLRTGVDLERVDPGSRGAGEAVLAGGARVGFDRILVATGRMPRTAGLGVEAAGIELTVDGAVEIDERLRTTNHGVYAVGDVTGGMPFTHVAAYHARVAAPNALLGLRRKTDHHGIPWVTFTDPEIAHVGLTVEDARARWGDTAVTTVSEYAELDRAITAGAPAGFALLVGDPRGRLVGATVAGPAAGEAIAELAAWINREAKIDAVSTTVHAYPTFAEGPARAADEHVRRRLLNPRIRRLARPALLLARLFLR